MTTTTTRPQYDDLIAALIELRAVLADAERGRVVRRDQYRRLGREADDLIDGALFGAAEDAGTRARFDGKRMRYTWGATGATKCNRRNG